MMRLRAEDRNRLIRLLAAQPILQTFRGRRQVLELAGLQAVLPQVDLEGATLVAVGEVVQVLEAYGRVTYQHHALGLFINSIMEMVGPGDPSQMQLAGILADYDLMTPIRSSAEPRDDLWDPRGNSGGEDEKIIGENTLRHVFFLQQGLAASRSVALVDAGAWTGTGFLISSDLLLTNNHVLPNEQMAAGSTFRFNYQLDEGGSEQSTQNYAKKRDGLFVTNTELDFTIVEIDDSPGTAWGHLVEAVGGAVSVGQRVNIIQHPAGLPKQISMQNNQVRYVDDKLIQYSTATMGGSSGSPVLSDEWKVVAVHHAGGNVVEPTTGRMYFRNEGIRYSAILESLPGEILRHLASGF